MSENGVLGFGRRAGEIGTPERKWRRLSRWGCIGEEVG